MEIICKFSRVAFGITVSACLVLSASCKSSSTTTSDDPNSGSIAGTWILKSIQCLSVPSDDFPCWKSFLIPLGEIDMPSNATSILNISANGTYTGDAMPMKDTLPRSIFACESDNPHTSKQHVDGTYSASEGLIIFHVVNYLVNDLKQLINNDEGSLDGSYAVSSTALIFTLDLGHGERWKATFSK